MVKTAEKGVNRDEKMPEIKQKCPDCGHKEFFVHKQKGEAICKNCSFVVDDSMIDFGYEGRIFDDERLAEIFSHAELF